MKKMYSMISIMLLAAVSLCAQAPNGYMEKGPLNEDFSRFEKVVVEEDWESGGNYIYNRIRDSFWLGAPKRNTGKIL